MKLSLSAILLATVAPMAAQGVKIESTTESIPTYQLGAPEIDPIFFTGRVYQGAEGYIYPYPLYDVLTENIVDQEYNVLRLGNEYVDISVLPQIGGRIFSATDHSNGYHFFYTQSGVKPALIGMLGAWLSGGVEWNIPDHHRASSYMAVNWTLQENPDGSKTIWVGETELRHRLKWSVGLTLYPGRSIVEATVKVVNPTPMIQSMLYWANVSVHCNEDYQVIFPPDVQAGADHHKVYFTQWPRGPVAPGQDEDLSWWKNFTVGTRSIFAWGSQMEFLAGYDHGKDAGTVHVANRHVVPGKKFFLWGNTPHGMMWDKILSDNDGPYLELMVGAYSDNQPDYSWIAPGETREFKQTWYPVRGIRGVKNATVDAAVNLEPDGEGKYLVGFCATAAHQGAKAQVTLQGQTLLEKTIDIDPQNYFLQEFELPQDADPSQLHAALTDSDGNVLVEYSPVKLEPQELPKVIDGTKPVEEYTTNEELYLAGLRVDQFNNARLSYMDFYNEALKRDSMDARVNIEVGKHYIRQGEWDKAENHLLKAQARLSHDYTRVKDTEALYYLGYLYRVTGRLQKAADNLWAATWTPQFKHAAFYQLAILALNRGDYTRALDLINQSLYVGARDLQALSVKAYILRKTGQTEQAGQVIDEIQSIDPLDYWSGVERSFLENDAEYLNRTQPHRSAGIIAVQELLEVVANYLTVGAPADAETLLNAAIDLGTPYADYPLTHYYKAYAQAITGRADAAALTIASADTLSPLNNFPMRIEELEMFDTLLDIAPDNAMLHYLYGNLLYYIGQKDAGLEHWTTSAGLNPAFSIACRNVGFGQGVKGNLDTAIEYYDKAIKANPDDALLLTESDKIYEQAKVDYATRLARLEALMPTVMKHDDAVMRLIALYNQAGEYDKAISILDNRHFHLWEGGGQVHVLYANSHMLKGISLLRDEQYESAITEFDLALQYPANLEVAPTHNGGYGAKCHYLAGLAYEELGQDEAASERYQLSAQAPAPGHLSDLSYYKALSLRKLGNTDEEKTIIGQMTETRDRMRENLMDSYAKFGEADTNVQQSELAYYCGLIELLQGDQAAAQSHFAEALSLYPGNIWAKVASGQ